MNTGSYIPPIRKETDLLLQRDLREAFRRLQDIARAMDGMQSQMQITITSSISGLSFSMTQNSDGSQTLTLNLDNKDSLRAALFIDEIAGAKSNRYSTTNPTATDDSGKGYSPGSVWINTTGADTIFMCSDATVGAAVWKQIS